MPGKKKAGKYTLGKKATTSELHDLELPSGATCQARRPGVQGLIKAGLLDSFDELTSLVQTEHIAPNTPAGRSKVTAADVTALLSDQDKLHTAFLLADKLAVFIVTAPLLWVDYKLTVKDPSAEGGKRVETDEEFAKREAVATEIDPDTEEPKCIAVREIDMDDKMYLLTWAVGGPADIAQFRTGTAELMAGVDSVEEVQLPAK